MARILNERTNERTNGDAMSDTQIAARATLDDLADRWRRCSRTIVELATFYGLDPSEWLSMDTPDLTVNARPTPVNGTAHRKRKLPGAKLETKRTGRKPRPTKVPTDTQREILAALKTASEPVSPGELAKAIKMEPANLFYHLKGLKAAGLVKAEGVSMSRRLSLA